MPEASRAELLRPVLGYRCIGIARDGADVLRLYFSSAPAPTLAHAGVTDVDN